MTTLFDIKAHKGDIGGSTYTPYKFNGKERDDETGYYYYGARYYDPSIALWFGTDPLAHKYPMNSPYIYCNGNPVKYVDPDGNIVLVAKLLASVGFGTGYGLSAHGEVGIACDKYGMTLFASATGNYFVNQNLQERSRNPRIFAGVYAGFSAGVDVSWGSDSYADYASSFLMSIPVGPASVSAGNEGAGISIGLGVGIAFESSPSSVMKSMSMSYEEFGAAMGILSTDSGIMRFDCDLQNDNYTIKENGVAVGYRGTAIFSSNSNTIRFDVTCKAVNGQPTYQWETTAYSANKQKK